MVNLDPHSNNRRRAHAEAAIRFIDLVVYALAFAGGVFALLVPPNTIRTQLVGYEWIGTGWGIMLVAAGLLGFIGRSSRLWIVEAPGTALAVAGGVIYAFILGITAPGSATAWVAFCLVAIATLELVRRYIELQIFTTDPEVKTLADRLRAAFRRRTANTAGSHR